MVVTDFNARSVNSDLVLTIEERNGYFGFPTSMVYRFVSLVTSTVCQACKPIAAS